MEAGSTDFVLKKDMILSPGAKDYLRNRSYTICYEGDVKVPLEKQITNLLIRDYGLTDANQIATVVKAVIKKLKG